MLAIVTAAMPVIIQLIQMGLAKWGADQETLQSFETLVQNSAQYGLISEDTKQVFLKQQQNLLAQLGKV